MVDFTKYNNSLCIDLIYTRTYINEVFGRLIGTKSICMEVHDLEYPYFIRKRYNTNDDITFEIRQYTSFGTSLVKIINS